MRRTVSLSCPSTSSASRAVGQTIDSAPQRSPYTLMLLENEFATTQAAPELAIARTA